jgi:SAM-dependent methyltransferase
MEIIMVPSFDAKIYMKHEAKQLQPSIDLQNHYLHYGIYEGHNVHCNSRNNYRSFPSFYKILEIGPYHSPICDHRQENVYSCDIFTQDELIERCKKDPNLKNDQIKNIPKTDFVIDVNKSMAQNITCKFDVIISSHNFEHFPNLIQALNDYSSILNNNGLIISFIPDCRFEFDKLRNETKLSDILADYYENVNISSFRNIFDQKLLSCHNNSVLHWRNHNKTLYTGTIKNSFEQDKIKNEKYKMFVENNTREDIDRLFLESQKTYFDTHNYTFTSVSFERYIKFLKEFNYIDLNIERIYHTIKNSNEFCVILKKI